MTSTPDGPATFQVSTEPNGQTVILSATGDVDMISAPQLEEAARRALADAPPALERLQVAAGKLESGKLFQAPTFTFTNRPPGGTVEPVTTIDDGRKLLRKQAVGDWLGGRDSNPDNVVQSHVSYR